MAFSFDSAFGIHQRAIAVRAERMQVIAANLANADTPGYHARDIDFREALRTENARVIAPRRTHARHLAGAAGPAAGADLKYRVPLQPSLDGNSVDPQFEQTSFADNAIRFQATLRFLDSRISGLSDAITGGMR